MHRGFASYLLRRAITAALLVLLVSSAALVLARLSAGEGTSLELHPAVAAAERARLGYDRPVAEQYVAWLARVARLDFGESLRFRRPVGALLREHAANTALLGLSALLVATLLGIPAGVVTGSRRGGPVVRLMRGASLLLLSIPPLITSLVLLLIAVRTGWLPAGGTGAWRHLVLPALALALPVAASLERLQSRAMSDALAEPSIVAAIARGVSQRRALWRHAWRLSLKPVLALYGIAIGSLLSGSFAVEIVTSWRGLGRLMYEALLARDINLVAGCAATGTLFLAIGILLSDLALAVVDPRVEDAA